MKRFYIILIIAFVFTQLETNAQGCVAIRANGSSCSLLKPGTDKGWHLNFNTRYFKSYKHFVGTIEQKHRTEEGSEVINYAFAWDFTLTRTLNKYWSLSVGIPLLSNVRSSLYEHGGSRHHTRSFGLGDLRLTAYRWVFDPAKAHKGNLQVGAGLKLATGDYRVQDFFYRADGVEVLAPVDQSIQLGDGGTGFIAELNGYYNFSHKVGVYGNFYYLMNPREQNGTLKSNRISRTDSLYGTITQSVADQYMLRGGVSFMANRFTFSGGVRMECIPSSDLIGGDQGFRRPGIVISAEPTIAYQAKNINLYFSMPWAIQRNRTQSDSDKRRTVDSGEHRQGDAAFADYLVSAGVSFRL